VIAFQFKNLEMLIATMTSGVRVEQTRIAFFPFSSEPVRAGRSKPIYAILCVFLLRSGSGWLHGFPTGQ
jgi:hypothetical protein